MSVTRQDDSLIRRIADFFGPEPPGRLGVAVSGGGDSLALLMLLKDWAKAGGPDLCVVTVDHGLRAEAAQEAAGVAAICQRLELPHDTLRWPGWDGRGNLPDRARRARYRLMQDWAVGQGLGHIALGHTADDQAETFLMRLAREAGVDGLSAMEPMRRQGAVTFCRPLLAVTREELRDVLRARDIGWIDDPTNEDVAYERVRARQTLAALAPLGLTAAGLSRVAGRLTQVRDTLYVQVLVAAREIVGFQAGDIVMARAPLQRLPDEIARRLLQRALQWVSGAEYPPRGRAIGRLMRTLAQGKGMTLQGCRITLRAKQVRFAREYNAVTALRAEPGALWDGRWRVTGPDVAGAVIAPLGQTGLNACAGRGESGLPASSLIATPAVWRGPELLAAPVICEKPGWRAELTRNEQDFFTSIMSH